MLSTTSPTLLPPPQPPNTSPTDDFVESLYKNPPVLPQNFPLSHQFPDKSLYAVEAALSLVQSKALNALSARNNTQEEAMGEMDHFLKRVGIELDDMNFVHIAGSKGKGSTSTYTESILHQHGYKTGLYTSPHLIDVRERFRVDTQTVSDDVFCRNFWFVWDKLLESLPEKSDDGKNTKKFSPLPAYFALLTLVGFMIYREQGVDVVVCEVGLGGKLDATNIIKEPLCTAITTLSLEHSEILGNTLAKISAEKCGIFKRNAQIITFPQEKSAWNVLLEKARLVSGMDPILIDTGETYPGVKLGIEGDFQSQNVNMAVILSMLAISELKKKGVEPKYLQKLNQKKLLQNHDMSRLLGVSNGSTSDLVKDKVNLDENDHKDDKWDLKYQKMGGEKNSEKNNQENNKNKNDSFGQDYHDFESSIDKQHVNSLVFNADIMRSSQIRKINQTLCQISHDYFQDEKNNKNNSEKSEKNKKNKKLKLVFNNNEDTPFKQAIEDFSKFSTFLHDFNKNAQNYPTKIGMNEVETNQQQNEDNFTTKLSLKHSTSRLHPTLNYPTFHIDTISPEVLFGICSTQLRGRCDFVEIFEEQNDEKSDEKEEQYKPKKRSIEWYIDGAHTPESITSSTNWFKEQTQHYIQNTSNNNSFDSESDFENDFNEKNIEENIQNYEKNNNNNFIEPKFNFQIHDSDEHSLALNNPLEESPNRILLFNCGHVRSPFNLMEPLINTLTPTGNNKLPKSLKNVNKNNKKDNFNQDDENKQLSFKNAHNFGQILTNSKNRKNNKWSVYLDSMFEHVFFCPFDQDKPHPIPLPSMESLFIQRYGDMGLGDDNGDVNVENNIEKNKIKKSQENKPNATQFHTDNTPLHPTISYDSKEYSLSSFQSLLERHSYQLTEDDHKRSISAQTDNKNLDSQPKLIGMQPVRWQLSNMVIMDFLVTSGALGNQAEGGDENDENNENNQNDPNGLQTTASLSLLTKITQLDPKGVYSKPHYNTLQYDYHFKQNKNDQNGEEIDSKNSQKSSTFPPDFSPNMSTTTQSSLQNSLWNSTISFHPPIATLTRHFYEKNDHMLLNNNSNNFDQNNEKTQKNQNTHQNLIKNRINSHRSMQYHVMPSAHDVVMAINHLAYNQQSYKEKTPKNFERFGKNQEKKDKILSGVRLGSKHDMTQLKDGITNMNRNLPQCDQFIVNNNKILKTNQKINAKNQNKKQSKKSVKPHVYVTGSLYLAGNVLKDLKQKV